MILAFQLFEVLATFIESFLAYISLEIFIEKNKAKKKKMLVLSAFLTVSIIAINQVKLFTYSTIIIALVFVCLTAKIYLEVSIKKTFFIVGTYYILLNVIDLFCISIMGELLGDVKMANYLTSHFSWARFFFILISKIILLILIVTFYKVNIKAMLFSVNKFIGVVIIGFIVLVFLMEKTFNTVNLNSVIWWSLFLFIISILCLTLIFYIKYYNEKQIRMNIELRNKMEEIKYTELLSVHQNKAKMIHDLHNHINILLKLVQGKSIEAEEYLKNMGAIDSELKNQIWTGDELIDFLLCNKIELAQRKGIQFIINADYIELKKFSITINEVISVLANLLDNAIEASEAIKEGDKQISVSMRVINEMLIIRVENNYAKEPVEMKNGLVSKKKNQELHGFGTLNIKSIIEKNEGVYSYSFEKGKFNSFVTLYMKSDS